MTPDELRAHITERIAADADIRRVLAAITAQTADLSDSQAYALHSGEISGKALAAALLDLDASERSASVFGILWDRYRDENRVFDEIQAILDKQLGIQLAPQHAAFPEARAKDMANALCDDTADPETLRRRAESAGNIIAAMHDGNVRANAEFRDRAGLQCSAIREGGAKCCEWCASVSGKYPASDTPQGFWGRHDNCKCSILYETRKGVQRLGGSAKKWEPLEDAGAPEPARLTAEQAAEREAQHPVIAFSRGQAASVHQNAVLIQHQNYLITEKHNQNSLSVNRILVNSKQYHDKFEGLTARKPVNEALYQQAKRLLEIRDGTDEEGLIILDARTGRLITDNLDRPSGQLRTGLTLEEYQRVKDNAGQVIMLHNHPDGSQPSGTDILTIWREVKADASVVVGHDGSVYIIYDVDRTIPLDKIYENVYNSLIAEGVPKSYAKIKAGEALYETGAFLFVKR